MRVCILSNFILVLMLSAGCQTQDEAEQSNKPKAEMTQEPLNTASSQEPERIEVQHILIAFDGSLPGRSVGRTKTEAQQQAMAVFALAQQGENFDTLVKEHTNDSYPGRYEMCNFGMTPSHAKEYPRNGMVPAFGDIGFKLQVGEIGLAAFDSRKSPYGWHVIKRLK